MDDYPGSIRAAADVLAYMESAVDAAARYDMQTMTQALGDAVAIYEQYPTEAHGTLSEIRKLIAFLHYARRFHRTLGWDDKDIRELQRRAQALTQPLQGRIVLIETGFRPAQEVGSRAYRTTI